MKYQDIRHKAGSPFADNRLQNVLQHDICLPAALIRQSALQHNLHWMQRFAGLAGVKLAPHGKTSMTTELFRQQLAAGAWGITVATPYQAQVAAAAGARQIIIANQLVGKANMAVIARLLLQNVQIYVCVDSLANARQLSDFFSSVPTVLPVLIEYGIAEGRCGCRNNEQVLQLALELATLPGIALAGIEFYEGVIKDGAAAVQQFAGQAAAGMQQLQQLQLLRHSTTLISGSGSAWYDIVSDELVKASLDPQHLLVIRPGCYITHDQGIYQQAMQQLLQRSKLVSQLGALQNALEVAAYVQSLPEPGLAIIGFGKRDAAYDAGLPVAVALYRDGQLISNTLAGCESVKMMDQHTYWHYSNDIQPQIGDILLFATSHPCLTFDKWRTLWLTDDHYNLLQPLETFF